MHCILSYKLKVIISIAINILLDGKLFHCEEAHNLAVPCQIAFLIFFFALVRVICFTIPNLITSKMANIDFTDSIHIDYNRIQIWHLNLSNVCRTLLEPSPGIFGSSIPCMYGHYTVPFLFVCWMQLSGYFLPAWTCLYAENSKHSIL